MVKLTELGELKVINNYRLNEARVLYFVFKNSNQFFPIKDQKIKINDIILERKNEMHLTLIGSEISLQIYHYYEDKSLFLKDFNEIVQKINERLSSQEFSTKNNFIFLKREKNEELRYSLIREIKTDFLNNVYEILVEKYGFSIEEPFPHITLYKQKENHGIGIDSIKDYNLYKVIAYKDISNFFK